MSPGDPAADSGPRAAPRACATSPADLIVTPLGLRFAGRVLPCALGRGGIARNKREGDGATPAGIHRITGMLYRPGRIAPARLPGWAEPVLPGDLWCDDPGHPAYNLFARAPLSASHERLSRPDPLYDLILTTDWNWPRAVPGRGSAIFVHTWRRPRFPTAGCVALARADLLWLAQRVALGARLVVPAFPARRTGVAVGA